MPPDLERLRETRAWFVRVGEDVRCAQIDLAAEPPVLKDALFHCQQATEKALKGFLVWHQCAFRKTHDLRALGIQCTDIDLSLKPLLLRAAPLSKYAGKFRYPGAEPDPSLEETQAALALAREVVEAILSRLPAEVRP
jgi:HEPN domain-containing protein